MIAGVAEVPPPLGDLVRARSFAVAVAIARLRTDCALTTVTRRIAAFRWQNMPAREYTVAVSIQTLAG